ncbi:hypothetical protein PPTG_24539 [Phytophthora nicotianae INRA-310]|uniref:Uncharacterized protein n=1 Tax=Phytophthora nicotianae (strain INRA-310) TaxID=761204 RepID=W2PFR2_PHYN3|nr:hypothetical protein PPTG_24539 [Phytophthora nicotianae INRA-310]ETM98834.1 hypothetical protein PPTG_24539 [Phytophthora nicotianae INRA-310]
MWFETQKNLALPERSVWQAASTEGCGEHDRRDASRDVHFIR